MDFKLFKFYKLSQTLKSLAFASIVTDKGELIYDGELVEGVSVGIMDEEGNGSPAPDGEYEAEDKIIVVAEGKVVEIREKEVEQPEKEEPKPEQPEEEVEQPKEEEKVEETPEKEPAKEEENKDARIAELEAKVNELEALVAERDARIAELEAELTQKNEELQMSAAEPAKDVVKKVKPVDDFSDYGVYRKNRE